MGAKRRAVVEEAEDQKKFSRTASVRFTEEQYEALETIANKTGLPVGTIIRVETLRNVNWEAASEKRTGIDALKRLLESAEGKTLLRDAVRAALRAK